MAKVELTDRQQQIMDGVEAGLTPPEIATKLGISDNAVYQQLRRIRDRGAKPKAGSASNAGRKTPGKAATAKPVAAPAAAPATLRDMTPLQAIRARRTAIEREVKDSYGALTGHQKALKAAEEAHERTTARHVDELKALERAEAAITSRPKAPTPAAATAKPAATKHAAAAKPAATPTAAVPDAAASPPLAAVSGTATA